ncbi:MAG: hypothetical protein LKJ25_06240 [Clostridia bacterium]|nr:hypothetical protein [Clostridia bacterium]
MKSMKNNNIQNNNIKNGNALQDCTVNIYSSDNYEQLLKNQDYKDIEDDFNLKKQSLFGNHVLYPDYGIDMTLIHNKLRMISKPLSAEAIKKYPPKIKISAKYKVGDKNFNKLSKDYISYANKHQLPIKMNITNAEKFLGNFRDPFQCEAENLIGQIATIPPKPFPTLPPCKLLIDGQVVLDYIVLKIQEVLDNGTCVISNKEQENCPFKLKFVADFGRNTTDFYFSIQNASNKEMLKYSRFMKKTEKDCEVTINALSSPNIIFKGLLKSQSYCGGFKSIDDEIEFLENIITIENYFKKEISIPENISSDDFMVMKLMCDLINGEKIDLSWEECCFEITVSDNLKEKIFNGTQENFTISYDYYNNYILFNNNYNFNIMRTFKNCKYKNLFKLKQKIKLSDLGDIVKIIFIPGEKSGKGVGFDCLKRDI